MYVNVPYRDSHTMFACMYMRLRFTSIVMHMIMHIAISLFKHRLCLTPWWWSFCSLSSAFCVLNGETRHGHIPPRGVQAGHDSHQRRLHYPVHRPNNEVRAAYRWDRQRICQAREQRGVAVEDLRRSGEVDPPHHGLHNTIGRSAPPRKPDLQRRRRPRRNTPRWWR